eukprot:3935249-Rhodomonas_salina.2
MGKRKKEDCLKGTGNVRFLCPLDALSGTDYGAPLSAYAFTMQCPVLTERVMLPGAEILVGFDTIAR